MKTTVRNLTLLATLTCLTAGSTLAADFSPKDVDTIAVLSVADVRKDKSVNLNKLDKIGQRTVRRQLKKSTYQLQFVDSAESVSTISDDDLEYLDPEWVRGLGSDERYVLLLVLKDAARKKTFGTAFGAVCSGYLFDTRSGEAVWQNEATGTMGQGGLIGLAMNNAMRGGAFENCAGNLMLTFPYTKRSKKKRG